MKRIVIAVVVVVLLAGGGGGFYYFSDGFGVFGSQSDEDGQTVADSGSGDEPIFLDFENMAIPVIRNNRVEKHLQLRITLEMTSKKARDDVEDRVPVVRDAFIRDLADYYAFQTTDEATLNIDAIKKRLKRAADRAVGGGKVRSVLIQAALERNATAR